MKSLVAFASILAVVMAQRPGYLKGPVGYPEVASRFKDDSQAASVSVNSRLGENGGITAKIPVDARGDVDLVNRLNALPRENRPFWFLNAEHIEAQRGGSSSAGQPVQQNVQGRFGARQFPAFDDFGYPETRTIRPVLTRGSFAGSL